MRLRVSGPLLCLDAELSLQEGVSFNSLGLPVPGHC